MKKESSELGFETTENWVVEDFQKFFHQTNILYNRLSVLNDIKVGGKRLNLKYALYGSLSRVEKENQLKIKSIVIHSPGDFSLLGLDKVICQLREFWKDISYRNKQDKESEEEKIRHNKVMNMLKEQAGRQDLLATQIKIMKDLGYDREQIDIGIKALGDPLEQLARISRDMRVSMKSAVESIS